MAALLEPEMKDKERKVGRIWDPLNWRWRMDGPT